MMNFTHALSLLVIITLTIIACSDTQLTDLQAGCQEYHPASPAAKALIREQKEEPNAFATLVGSDLCIRGELDDVEPGDDGATRLEISSGAQSAAVSCTVQDDDRARSLQPQQFVTVRGEISGDKYRRGFSEYPVLHNCRLTPELTP